MANGWLHNSKPFVHMGVSYPSFACFCRTFGLGEGAVRGRLRRGITDERLTSKRLRAHVPVT